MPSGGDAPGAAPRDASGEPSTGIDFGGENTASIDELLASSSEHPSENGRDGEQRQAAAVGETPRASQPAHAGDLIDLRSTLGGEAEDDNIAAAVSAAADSVAAEDTSGSGSAAASPMPIAGSSNAATPSRDREFTLNAATPMNEVFLSSLVLQPRSSESSLSHGHGPEVRDSPILEEDEPPLSPDSRGSRTDFESPLQSRPASQHPSRPGSASLPPSRSSSQAPAPRAGSSASGVSGVSGMSGVSGVNGVSGVSYAGTGSTGSLGTPARDASAGLHIPSGPVSALSGPGGNAALGLPAQLGQLGSPLSLGSLNPSSGSSISESPFSTPMLVPGGERKDGHAVSAVSSLPPAGPTSPASPQHA